MNSPLFDLSSTPQATEPEVKQPRNYFGWVVLVFLFVFLIGGELDQYLKREKTNPGSQYSESLNQLQFAVRLKRSMPSTASGGFDMTLRQVEDRLRPDSTKDEIAARLFAATLSEQKKDVPAPVLEVLKKSKEPRDQVFAKAFGEKKLTPEAAAKIEKDLAGGGFVSRWATAQAFEKAGDDSRWQKLAPPGSGMLRMGVLLIAGLAFLTGFVLLIAYGVLKGLKQLPSKGFPTGRITLADADRLAVRAAQLFAIFVAVQMLGQLFAPLATANGRYLVMVLTYLILIFCFLSIFSLPVGGRTFTLANIGISKDNLGKNIAWGFGTAMANLPLVLTMALLGNWIFSGLPKPEHPITNQLSDGIGLIGTLVMLFAASVGAPILEEIMFRGTLMPALARILNRPVIAILIQGLLFAAIHPTGIPAWLPLATIGAMSGFLVRQTGSLVPSMVMHAVHNFGTLIVAKAMMG